MEATAVIRSLLERQPSEVEAEPLPKQLADQVDQAVVPARTPHLQPALRRRVSPAVPDFQLQPVRLRPVAAALAAQAYRVSPDADLLKTRGAAMVASVSRARSRDQPLTTPVEVVVGRTTTAVRQATTVAGVVEVRTTSTGQAMDPTPLTAQAPVLSRTREVVVAAATGRAQEEPVARELSSFVMRSPRLVRQPSKLRLTREFLPLTTSQRTQASRS